MSGFSDTMDKSNEPSLEPAPPALASSATAAQQAAYTTAQTNWQTKKVEYDRTLANWNERSRRAYMAIRSKCAFNNFKKVEHLTRVYEMIDVLRAGCEMGSEKLMELTTRFYGLHCSDCENIADFSGQLSQINHTLRDFHPDTAFSEVQLILRFLQGLVLPMTLGSILSPNHLFLSLLRPLQLSPLTLCVRKLMTKRNAKLR
jgi:hypothetical protein